MYSFPQILIYFYTTGIVNGMSGKELRKRRKDLGLTQEQLAERLEVTANTVARWERDEMKIPPFLGLAIETIERSRKETALP